MKIKSSKSQITIFIIIAIIVIFLLIFLLNLDSEEKSRITENSKTSTSETNSKLFPLKNNVDYCLDKQLRRALIIAGIKGGFIYDKGEYYFPTTIPKNTYSNEFIANLDLNWNNLLHNTLVHSQTEVYSPWETINETNSIYNHTIKEDFEKFILDEFVKCIDLENYESRGYKIEFEKYKGELKTINPNQNYIEIINIESIVGDNIKMKVEEKEIIGKVILANDSWAKVEFENNALNNLYFSEELSSIEIINTNNTLKVEVTFQDEFVSADLIFPVTIKKENFTSSYKNSHSNINIRFKKLLELSKFILDNKNYNKQLDLTNSDTIKNITNKNFYFKNTKEQNIEIYRNIINNSEEQKKYIYSIVDKDNKILGNPYVFNFGYENEAPIIDINKLGGDGYENNNVLFIISKNHPITLNLMKITSDKQLIDNYLSHYIPDEYQGPDARYSLSSDGTLEFIAYQEKRYVFEIKTTDDETTRSQTFIFVSGFPDNTNNSAAIDCFTFFNKEKTQIFPIEPDFKNKIFNYTNNGIHILYGYQLYVPPTYSASEKPEESILKFSQTCFYDPSQFEPTLKINGVKSPNNINSNTGEITLPHSNISLEISVEIIQKSNQISMTEPFNITIYPSTCLGPNIMSPTKQKEVFEFEFNNGLPGGSCCDTTSILNSIKNKNPKSFIGANSAIFNDLRKVIDTQMYFCAEINKNSNIMNYFEGEINYETKNVWSETGRNDITSLFSGKITSTCKGLYPNPLSGNNLNPITPTTTNDYNTQAIALLGFGTFQDINPSIPISLTKIKNANKCEFCYIENKSGINFLNNKGIVFTSGFINRNSRTITTIPASSEYANFNIMCSENWFGHLGDLIWQNANSGFGKGGDPSPIIISKGYCEQNSNNCNGKENTPTTISKVDDSSSPNCSDWYFDGTALVSQPITCPNP